MKKNTLRRRMMGLGLAAAALLAVSSPVSAQAVRDPMAMPAANEDSIMKHVIELSSETYHGRLAGSAGYDAAVDYVRRTLADYGIGSDLQHFTLECNEVENCKFNLYTPGTKDKRTFILGNDYCCAGMTGRGYIDANMVFVGYGIDNEVYNEYAKVDVQGKIVVVLTGLPEHPWLPSTCSPCATRRGWRSGTAPSACWPSTPAPAACPTSRRGASTAASRPTWAPSPSCT